METVLIGFMFNGVFSTVRAKVIAKPKETITFAGEVYHLVNECHILGYKCYVK